MVNAHNLIITQAKWKKSKSKALATNVLQEWDAIKKMIDKWKHEIHVPHLF